MAVGSSSNWRHCRNRRSPPRRCAGSMTSSRSSEPSTAGRRSNVLLAARSGQSRSSTILKSGCASSATASRRATTSPKPSITSSAVGSPSPASSTMAGSVYPTMLRSEHCAVLRSAGKTGPSRVRMPADIVPPRSTPSLRPAYAARGIRRFMPSAELCRAVPDRHVVVPVLRRVVRTAPRFHSA